jgi:hypothetical protein
MIEMRQECTALIPRPFGQSDAGAVAAVYRRLNVAVSVDRGLRPLPFTSRSLFLALFTLMMGDCDSDPFFRTLWSLLVF